MPEELRELLGFSAGMEGCLAGIDFTGECMMFEMEDLFPRGLPVAADGCGNFWVLDLTPQTTRTAPVFYASHDAPVILYQCSDLASFMGEVFRGYTAPHRSLVDDVHEDRLFNVWRKNPGVLSRAQALTAADPVLAEFVASLPENFEIVDLRKVEPGMGFSWGRYGADTELKRHGHERIFAYRKPERPKGFFAKIFGG